MKIESEWNSTFLASRTVAPSAEKYYWQRSEKWTNPECRRYEGLISSTFRRCPRQENYFSSHVHAKYRNCPLKEGEKTSLAPSGTEVKVHWFRTKIYFQFFGSLSKQNILLSISLGWFSLFLRALVTEKIIKSNHTFYSLIKR